MSFPLIVIIIVLLVMAILVVVANVVARRKGYPIPGKTNRALQPRSPL